MTDLNEHSEERLEPCPWCGALSDATDQWGYLITHKETCYWRNVQGDPIGRIRVCFSEAKRWNTRARASVAAPQGDALTWYAIADARPMNTDEEVLLYRPTDLYCRFWVGRFSSNPAVEYVLLTAKGEMPLGEFTHWARFRVPVTAPVGTGEQTRDLLYRFARHVRNTDEIAPPAWGVGGLNLLAELRELNPDRYDREVRAANPIRPATPSTSEAIRAAAEAVGEYLQAPPSMWNTIERLIAKHVAAPGSPSPAEPRVCVKCGDDGEYLDKSGRCWAIKGDDHCLCTCVFEVAALRTSVGEESK